MTNTLYKLAYELNIGDSQSNSPCQESSVNSREKIREGLPQWRWWQALITLVIGKPFAGHETWLVKLEHYLGLYMGFYIKPMCGLYLVLLIVAFICSVFIYHQTHDDVFSALLIAILIAIVILIMSMAPCPIIISFLLIIMEYS